MLARLRHDALPRVSDHFVEDSGQFLVMEFIPGQDLDGLLHEKMKSENEPFGWQQVAEWADRLLDALEYIHRQRPPIIHRDIKPQNLKLTPDGELFLIDFGLAKDATTPTKPGRSVHAYTLNYAPPEQLKGTGTDARSDLYSLGATLHHLLSGEMPENAKVREEVIRYGVPDPLRPIHEINPKVPAALTKVIVRSMVLDRTERYQSAKAMREAFRQAFQSSPPDADSRKGQSRTPLSQEEELRRQKESLQNLLAEQAHRPQEITEPDPQEKAERERQEAEQRRRKEEERLLAEQRRQEEEKLQTEARQRELEAQRKRTEEEQRIAEQKRLEQEAAEKRRREEEQLRQELSPSDFERKRKKEIERRKRPGQVTRVQATRTSPKFEPSAQSPVAEKGGVPPPPLVEPQQDFATAERLRRKARLRLSLIAGAAALIVLSLANLLWFKHETNPALQTNLAPQPVASPTTELTEKLRYWFELKDQTSPVTRGELDLAQQFKLHFKTVRDGYLYLLVSDERERLFPYLSDDPVKSGEDVVFPAPKDRWIRSGKNELRFTVLFANKRIENFIELAENAGRIQSQLEAIASFKALVDAVSPGSTDDLSGRGVSAVAVGGKAENKPLIFDISVVSKSN